MDRRKSLKVIALGTMSTGLFAEACRTADKKKVEGEQKPVSAVDRMPEEKERDERLMKEKFFTAHEMATIEILSNIIIPADEISGSATDAKVPDFIEFIVKDMPGHQTPMRGGLRWLDVQCLKRHGKSFKDCDETQRIEIVDEIAYPDKAKTGMKQGVAFFNLIRNLTATGFYTSSIGVKDIGYSGNVPNQWNGVPDDVLKQYGLRYTEKELRECVSFEG